MRFKLLIILLFPLCVFAQRRTSNNSTLTKGEVNTLLSSAASNYEPIQSGTGFVKKSGTTVSYDNNTYQTVSGNTGGWTQLKVSGSDFTTTSTSLTDVTGLVSSTLSNSTLYEFEAVLYVNSSSTAGMTVGIQQSGSGTGSIGVFSGTATNGAATGMAIGNNALNTASAACVLVNGDGTITIRGFIKTSSAGSPAISIKVAKATSGTAKVYIGSTLRFRAA